MYQSCRVTGNWRISYETMDGSKRSRVFPLQLQFTFLFPPYFGHRLSKFHDIDFFVRYEFVDVTKYRLNQGYWEKCHSIYLRQKFPSIIFRIVLFLLFLRIFYYVKWLFYFVYLYDLIFISFLCFYYVKQPSCPKCFSGKNWKKANLKISFVIGRIGIFQHLLIP